jgi:2'-5' RNA ligase
MTALRTFEDRDDFSPHLTLGRVKGPKKSGALVERIREAREAAFGSFRVDELVLFESRLGPRGSTYTVVARFPLG